MIRGDDYANVLKHDDKGSLAWVGCLIVLFSGMISLTLVGLGIWKLIELFKGHL